MKSIIGKFVTITLAIIVILDSVWFMFGNAIGHKFADYFATEALREEIEENYSEYEICYNYQYTNDDGTVTSIYVDTENDIVEVHTFL